MKQRKWLVWLTVGIGTFVFGYGVSNEEGFFYEKIRRATAVVAFDTKIEPIKTNINQQIDEAADKELEQSVAHFRFSNFPSGFKDFQYLSLSVSKYDKASGALPLSEGGLIMKKKYRLERISANSTEFSFETVSINGIKYKFVGNFLRQQRTKANYYENIFFNGILTKFKNNRQKAKAEVGFKFDGGCSVCF